MPNWWLLTRLDLSLGSKTSFVFSAGNGDKITIQYENLDKIVELADYSLKKIKRGVRLKIQIEFFVENNITKADFLRMCRNAEEVSIIYSEPLNLSNYSLVIETFECEKLYSSDKFYVKATGWVQQKLDNIPAL